MSKEKFELEFGTPVDVVKRSSGQLTLAQGRMFGAVYESMLFGINFILFVGLLYMFSREKQTTLSQRIRLGVVCLVFLLCGAHLAAVMRGLYLAFFVSGDPENFYLDHTQPVDLTQKAVYAVATFFADGLLIFRAYIIFSGKWYTMVVPLASLISTVALWGALIHGYATSTPGTILFPHKIKQLAVASFAMSFITNVIITIMICVRIWLALRRFRETGMRTTFYYRFIAFTVESGLLYPLVLLISAIFFATDNNGLEILSGSNTQVLGIVPILLTLQLRLNLSAYDNATAGTKVGTLEFNSDGPATGQTTSAYDVELDGTRSKSRSYRKPVRFDNSSGAGSGTMGDSLHSESKREPSQDDP
ncbi:hypothetical protein R3P38DRAFT_2920674 [Favolaschia claudopus]|uniref:Pheromone receptor n=1 Tax=Favolaschia claudopus TaxID=2862362 RepID=A0AAW0C379_9AGAR